VSLRRTNRNASLFLVKFLVQAAINAASKGATVVIPDGSYTWSQPATSNNFVHIKAQDYGKVTIIRAYTRSNGRETEA
jgi:predicted proteasome-type protease